MLKNRQLPSLSTTTTTSSDNNKKKEKEKEKKEKKKNQSFMRSPLRDLNKTTTSSKATSFRSSTSSSNLSIDIPNGCLRFFLSNTSKRPSNIRRPNFKSAPNPNSSKPSSCSSSRSITNQEREKENLRKPTSRNDVKTYSENSQPILRNSYRTMPTLSSAKVPNQKQKKKITTPASEGELGKPSELGKLPESGSDFVEKSTPTGKLTIGSLLECEIDKTVAATTTTTTTNTTPPVQASVSPEILCGSSSSTLPLSAAKTPACYGAGHIVSGVADRRKCRARGILTVGQNDNLNILKNGYDDLRVVGKSVVSSVPSPPEASMHWLLSPCEEEGEEPMTYNSRRSFCSIHPPSFGHTNCSDLCSVFGNNSSTTTNGKRKTRITVLSPNRCPASGGISVSPSGNASNFRSSVSPSCEAGVLKEVKKHRYGVTMEGSPSSLGSLGSGNVIRTPQSETSSDRHVDMSFLSTNEKKRYDFGYDIDSATKDLSGASLSPRIHISKWDPSGFNFHLPEFVSPTNTAELEVQNVSTQRASGISNPTLEDRSLSEVRISWRDGLTSRIFEMDEFDCCRCLSEDENDANKSSNCKLRSSLRKKINDHIENVANLENCCGPLEFVGHVPKCDGERKDDFVIPRSNPCAESITTDGGLMASGESDWTSCYKNQLFDL